MVVVGLPPNCDIQALQKQYVTGKFEGSGKLLSALSYQNNSRVEPNLEPQVGFLYKTSDFLYLEGGGGWLWLWILIVCPLLSGLICLSPRKAAAT